MSDAQWTVGELIDELSDYDEDKVVVIHDPKYAEDFNFALDDLNEDEILRLEIKH